jgi:hypothetical protein
MIMQFETCRMVRSATICKVKETLILILKRGPSRLLPSDSAPILQYGNGPSSDFLAKILGVDTPPLLWKTQFYFSLVSLFLHILVYFSSTAADDRQVSLLFPVLGVALTKWKRPHTLWGTLGCREG